MLWEINHNMITLSDLLYALAYIHTPNRQFEIVDAVIDSRLAKSGSIFIAFKGEKVDGHNYVQQAFENGASFALISNDLSSEFSQIDVRQGKQSEVEQFDNLQAPLCILVDDTLLALQKIAKYWRSQLSLEIVGITGSVGKTTTKEIVADVLSQRFSTAKNKGNFNNEIGLPLTILSLTKSHQKAVLEMGFYVPGEIEFLCDIAKPSIGVVTNIGMVHAERAGSQEVIARGKSELIASLPSNGTAILNFDDPLVRSMADLTDANILFYGLSEDADLYAKNIIGLGLKGISFDLFYKGEKLHLKIPLLGRHSVHTALRATAVGLASGMEWEDILLGLRFGNAQIRLVTAEAPNGAILIDDSYNASPQSTIAALNLLAEIPGNKIAILGDMLELGQYEESGHKMVGLRAAEIANQIITVGNKARIIAEAAIAAGFDNRKITSVQYPIDAINLLATSLKSDDVILVKGSLGANMGNIVPELEKLK
jgi:UDP-N-acetylmuramoyl-tripeptide--D-alanyl-D-alanine ligase